MSERIALTLEYDGTAFCGWQRQLGPMSVQQALEEALAEIVGQKVGVIAVGRTHMSLYGFS